MCVYKSKNAFRLCDCVVAAAFQCGSIKGFSIARSNGTVIKATFSPFQLVSSWLGIMFSTIVGPPVGLRRRALKVSDDFLSYSKLYLRLLIMRHALQNVHGFLYNLNVSVPSGSSMQGCLSAFSFGILETDLVPVLSFGITD